MKPDSMNSPCSGTSGDNPGAVTFMTSHSGIYLLNYALLTTPTSIRLLLVLSEEAPVSFMKCPNSPGYNRVVSAGQKMVSPKRYCPFWNSCKLDNLESKYFTRGL
jgi:hypothetical protein